jgi:hypothetical protein
MLIYELWADLSSDIIHLLAYQQWPGIKRTSSFLAVDKNSRDLLPYEGYGINRGRKLVCPYTAPTAPGMIDLLATHKNLIFWNKVNLISCPLELAGYFIRIPIKNLSEYNVWPFFVGIQRDEINNRSTFSQHMCSLRTITLYFSLQKMIIQHKDLKVKMVHACQWSSLLKWNARCITLCQCETANC